MTEGEKGRIADALERLAKSGVKPTTDGIAQLCELIGLPCRHYAAGVDLRPGLEQFRTPNHYRTTAAPEATDKAPLLGGP